MLSGCISWKHVSIRTNAVCRQVVWLPRSNVTASVSVKLRHAYCQIYLNKLSLKEEVLVTANVLFPLNGSVCIHNPLIAALLPNDRWLRHVCSIRSRLKAGLRAVERTTSVTAYRWMTVIKAITLIFLLYGVQSLTLKISEFCLHRIFMFVWCLAISSRY